MTSLLRSFALALLGLALAGLGVFHAVHSYPGTDTFRCFCQAMPTVTVVLSYSLGVLCACAGVLMLSAALYKLRHRPSKIPVRPSPSGGGSYSMYRGDEDDGFDEAPDADPYRGRPDNGRLDHQRYAAGGYR